MTRSDPRAGQSDRPQRNGRASSGIRAVSARPQRPRRRRRISGLLLTPGAGASADHPSLVAIGDAVAALGLPVVRMDFPYRLAGKRRPDQPATLEAAVREGAARLATSLGVDQGSLVLGGRSMGGRICSQVVAEGFPAAGLVLVSYPLHPPGRPDNARTAHFPALGVPCLFVSGTRDAFGTPTELEAATTAIPASVTHVWVEGGDHSLRNKGSQVTEPIVRWLASSFLV